MINPGCWIFIGKKIKSINLLENPKVKCSLLKNYIFTGVHSFLSFNYPHVQLKSYLKKCLAYLAEYLSPSVL